MTLEDKLNKLRPSFEHMRVLYGERSNVASLAIDKFGMGEDMHLFDQCNLVEVYLIYPKAIPTSPRTPIEILQGKHFFQAFDFFVELQFFV